MPYDREKGIFIPNNQIKSQIGTQSPVETQPRIITEEEYNSIRSELDATKAELVATKEELVTTKEERDQVLLAKLELESQFGFVIDLNKKLGTRIIELEAIQNEVTVSNTKLQAQIGELEELKNKFDTLNTQFDSVNGELSSTKKKLTSTIIEYSALNMKLRTMTGEKKNYETYYKRASGEITSINYRLKEANDLIRQLQETNTTLSENNSELQGMVTSSNDQALEMRTINESLRKELETLNSRFEGETARIKLAYQQDMEIYKNMIIELRPGFKGIEPFNITNYILSKIIYLEFTSLDLINMAASHHTHFTFQKELLMHSPQRLDMIIERLNRLNRAFKEELIMRDGLVQSQLSDR